MTQEEKFAKMPASAAPMIEVIRQYMLEEMPDKPKQGEWYRCTTGGLCANGEPYYGAIKLGRENKLLVLLCGGGFAIDEYTASRPQQLVQ